MTRFLKVIGLGLALSASLVFAASTPLAPGQGITSINNNGSLPTTGLVTTGTFNLVNPLNPAQTATVVEDVYRTTGGTLDFYYQVDNTSTAQGGHPADPLNEASFDSYTGFTTSVAYDSGNGGTLAPINSGGGNVASRAAGGDTVNFFFTLPPGDGQLAPGETSYFLEIDTNATTWNGFGEASVIDGGTAFAVAIQPAPTVPEPMTMGLIGGGLALLGIARWRRSNKKD